MLLAVLAALPIGAAAGVPVLSADPAVHDFGEIVQGDAASCVFVLKNLGTADLVIDEVRTTCGCTVAEPTKTTLAPGESTEVAATYNSANQSGRQTKRIVVRSNDPKNPEFALTLGADVRVELAAEPRRVRLTGLAAGETRRETVTLRNTARRDLAIGSIQSDADFLRVSGKNGQSIDGPFALARGKKLRLIVELTYPASTPQSFVHGNVVVAYAEPGRRPLEIGVTATRKP
jgi:hypothetical protein